MSNSGIGVNTQALNNNYARIQRTASNIAHGTSQNKLPEIKGAIDLTDEKLENKALCKTIAVQNRCTDALLDIFA